MGCRIGWPCYHVLVIPPVFTIIGLIVWMKQVERQTDVRLLENTFLSWTLSKVLFHELHLWRNDCICEDLPYMVLHEFWARSRPWILGMKRVCWRGSHAPSYSLQLVMSSMFAIIIPLSINAYMRKMYSILRTSQFSFNEKEVSVGLFFSLSLGTPIP